VADGAEVSAGGEWEDVSGSEDEEEVEEMRQYLRHRMLKVDEVTNELILPDGKTLGHRTLLRYYQQKPAPISRSNNGEGHRRKATKLLSGLMGQYRALTWTTKGNEPMGVQAAYQEQNKRDRVQLHVQLRKNNQKHYREQIDF